MPWKRLPAKENYRLIPHICLGTAISFTAVRLRHESGREEPCLVVA